MPRKKKEESALTEELKETAVEKETAEVIEPASPAAAEPPAEEAKICIGEEEKPVAVQPQA